MARRKPAGHSWETFVDRQIREAQERGEWDRLPGRGKPIQGLGESREPDWWIRKKLRDEQFVALPPALQLRREVDQAREEIERTDSEHTVREIVASINARIRYVNRTIVHGPPSTVMILDEEDVLRRWRSARDERAS